MTKSSQKQRVLKYMQEHGSITGVEAYNAFACTRLPARISNLKEEGHIITTRMELGTNCLGEPTRYARYFLVK